MNASLYIVSTPIGNLEDITLRAIRILKEASVIACEDTRQTRKLLNHFGIETPALSYHEHNEAARTTELLDRLRSGQSVALVSDAGTPLISDPGYRLVYAAVEAGIPVVPIPGASAVLSGLAAAGLATDQFRFCGFLPPKSGQRLRLLEQLGDEEATLVFYEAPHRIVATLQDLVATLGPQRPVVVARELTKLHEEFLRGPAEEVFRELASRASVRGEIVLLVGKGEPMQAAPGEELLSIADAVRALEAQGVERMEAMKQIARRRGLSKREVYKELNG